jgi:hypothetical protein
MATITECFETAFPHIMRMEGELEARGPGVVGTFRRRTHMNFDAHSVFVSVLLPVLPETSLEAIVTELLRDPRILLDLKGGGTVTLPNLPAASTGTSLRAESDGSQLTLKLTGPDGTMVSSGDMIFTRRVYVYCDQEISAPVRTRLDTFARQVGIVLSLRDTAYARTVDLRITPKVFISHDSRDKDEIARPLARALQRLHCPVWYDEFSLRVGDSLRESIERGLTTSRFCILILTPNFLAKGGWPKREYDTAFTREVLENVRVFLPVWHGVTKEDVYKYSPILADRVGLLWSKGVDDVCKQLFRTIEEQP